MQDNRLLLLKKFFGYTGFRPPQEAAISSLQQGQDVLLLMPTGGGKSLCFQLPALLNEGLTLVISPLIALMKDQVQALRANGIAADYINSSLDQNESIAVRSRCRDGLTKLLYLAPETLVSMRDNFLNELNISLIAIDEAHCISSWGHDFRPEYQQLGFLKEKFSSIPFIALTATADKLTRRDIITQLKLKDPQVYISSFDRKNLSIDVRRGINEAKKIDEIVSLINKHPNDAGIIYCLSRKNTEKLVGKLTENGIKCAFYHAGMSSEERSQTQEDFTNDNTKVIVATVAFGMGIDKSNVRYVIHYNLPKNIESYYQEIGRAGRDGLNSETLLFFSVGDIISLKRFASESGNPELNHEKLRQMQELAEARICRRKILLNYFSQHMTEDCGNCDVCKNPPKLLNGSIYAQKALSALLRAEEKIGFSMLINILRGSKNAELFQLGFHKIKTYGQGAELSYEDWQNYLMQFLQMGLLELAYDENYSLKVTPFGMHVVAGKQEIYLVHPEPKERQTKTKKSKRVTAENISESKQNPMFEKLRLLRKQIADRLRIPPFIVFGDSTLAAMVEKRPANEQEMLQISGVSDKKMAQYGHDFLKAIQGNSEFKKPDLSINLNESLSNPIVEKYIAEMQLKGLRISHNLLSKILVANEDSEYSDTEKSLTFYGLFKEGIKFTEIRKFLAPYFEKYIYSECNKEVEEFFAPPIHNFLSEEAISEFTNAILNIPIEKPTESLSEALQELRKSFPRSHEPWSNKEIELYQSAVQHTNDLAFLSKVLQRSENSVKANYANLLKMKKSLSVVS